MLPSVLSNAWNQFNATDKDVRVMGHINGSTNSLATSFARRDVVFTLDFRRSRLKFVLFRMKKGTSNVCPVTGVPCFNGEKSMTTCTINFYKGLIIMCASCKMHMLDIFHLNTVKRHRRRRICLFSLTFVLPIGNLELLIGRSSGNWKCRRRK